MNQDDVLFSYVIILIECHSAYLVSLSSHPIVFENDTQWQACGLDDLQITCNILSTRYNYGLLPNRITVGLAFPDKNVHGVKHVKINSSH